MLNSNQIKENHSNTWRTIWKVYNANQKFFKGFMFKTSVILNLFILSYVIVLKANVFLLICEISDLYISVLPNLLGFNLGSYALLIGFSSSIFLTKLTKEINKGFTFFQKASSIFAISIVLQAFTLILIFIIKQIIEIQSLSTVILFEANNTVSKSINYFVFFIINFLGLYSLLLILMLIKNIFGLSQMANFLSGIGSFKNNKEGSSKG